ncbi:MAG TPA: HipA domain-containing protein, partial [Gammaproteobacteria bacterium]|nr:HipA domain-containing protein [Gammaproteobacteria bacterium]
LEHPEKFALDPALKLTEGAFHTKQGMSIFGAIGDSAPDRWGRILMRRAETVRAKSKNSALTTLFEIDYLLGVNDEVRQGALRFSMSPHETVFLAPKKKASIPPLVELPKLLSATERFIENDESAADLKLLLGPGSSLGGARPKASVRDKDGSLAIAKFPRKDDEFNLVVWEALALTLAKKAGITVPSWRLETILEKPVLIIKRFDRDNGQRIPFLSAMSMLGAADNEQHSYLEMAYALVQNGAAPDEDMTQLWRRIIFTVMISNTDDHLRNHGFIYQRYKGWRLCPAYDLNPTPIEIRPRILTTAIDFYDTTASLETAMSVAKEFRLQKEQALSLIKEVGSAVKQWRQVASELGLSKRECDQMSSAFQYERRP